MKKIKTVSNLKNAVTQYTKNNSKEYILVSLIFIIGLFLGVMVINNCSEEKELAVTNYIDEFVDKFKGMENVDTGDLLASSAKSNIALAIIIWLAGTTIIGMPIVLGLILFRGFCLGFTISSATFTLGVQKGILFCISSVFLQNILFIPALLTMGVSSIKLYKSIVNDRRKENIKIEIIRHTVISLIMLAVLLASSFIENEISVRLLQMTVKHI